MKTDHGDHFEATLGIHTGSVTFTRPSLGSWVSYGLGSMNQNLPSFVVLAPELPYAGGQVWASDFLPACHQGTRIVPGAEPIPNMRPLSISPEIQQMELGLLDFFNRKHLERHESDPALAARIKSFETAFGMQQEAGDVCLPKSPAPPLSSMVSMRQHSGLCLAVPGSSSSGGTRGALHRTH
jgi:hypothetical protein